MNKCTKEFDVNDGVKVLVDFINFIVQVNNYDRKFTIKDLYEKYKTLDHKWKMEDLKEFLEKASEYSRRLAAGERIDNIFVEMAANENLYDISEDGIYYYPYTYEESLKVELDEMHQWTKEKVDDEMYAMLYAYGKMFDDSEEQSNIEIINKKMKEMKQR